MQPIPTHFAIDLSDARGRIIPFAAGSVIPDGDGDRVQVLDLHPDDAYAVEAFGLSRGCRDFTLTASDWTVRSVRVIADDARRTRRRLEQSRPDCSPIHLEVR